jgi:hypothetical protein
MFLIWNAHKFSCPKIKKNIKWLIYGNKNQKLFVGFQLLKHNKIIVGFVKDSLNIKLIIL